MPLVTVFTPTFNRAGKLHRVFNSLINQSYKDFEWIIVDDGSTDETEQQVRSFINEQPFFRIRYQYQENGGKHIAINTGVQMATGEWFHIADSDDELDPQTLEIFMNTFVDIPAMEKDEYCGIIACCKDQFGNRISDEVPGGVFDGRLRELFYKYKFRKEFFHIYKTAVMKEFPFPSVFRKIYYPEGLVWRKMTDKYRIKAVGNELRIYYVENTGDSLMSVRKKYKDKATTACIESADVLNNDLSYFFYYASCFCKAAIIFYAYRPFMKRGTLHGVALNRNAVIFALPFIVPGLLMHLLFRIKDAT